MWDHVGLADGCHVIDMEEKRNIKGKQNVTIQRLCCCYSSNSKFEVSPERLKVLPLVKDSFACLFSGHFKYS